MTAPFIIGAGARSNRMNWLKIFAFPVKKMYIIGMQYGICILTPIITIFLMRSKMSFFKTVAAAVLAGAILMVIAKIAGGINWDWLKVGVAGVALGIAAVTGAVAITKSKRKLFFKQKNEFRTYAEKLPETFIPPLEEDRIKFIEDYKTKFSFYFEKMSKNPDLKPLLDHILSFENYPDIFCALFAKSETIDEWLKLPFLRQKEDIDKIQKGPVYEAALIRITEERKKAST